jgi:hypothetical protein
VEQQAVLVGALHSLLGQQLLQQEAVSAVLGLMHQVILRLSTVVLVAQQQTVM